MGGRLAAAVGLAVLGFAVGRHTAGQEQERSWAAYTGRDWRGVIPPAKRAYLAGVLLRSAPAAAGRGGGEEPAPLRRDLGSPYRARGLPGPPRPTPQRN